MARKKKIKMGVVVKYLIMLIILIIVIFPYFWLLTSSLKAEKDIISYPPRVFADSYTLKQYVRVFKVIPLWNYIKNTVIFAGCITIGSLFFDSMAGYAFARMNFKGKEVIFSALLVTMMIPFCILMIPLFLEIYLYGLLDTYQGLILPRLTSAYGIFLMRSFYISLPKDLEEAARIDGLNEFKIWFKIMMPLCKPAMITLGIFTLLGNWNDLLYPLMLTNTTKMRTLPAGLAMFVGERVVEYGPTIAGTMISILPMLVLYICAQRYFVEGIAISGMKE